MTADAQVLGEAGEPPDLIERAEAVDELVQALAVVLVIRVEILGAPIPRDGAHEAVALHLAVGDGHDLPQRPVRVMSAPVIQPCS